MTLRPYIILLFISLSTIGYTQKNGSKAIYEEEKNILYRTDENLTEYMRERCVLDFYYPKDQNDFSTIVWFHGGGMKAGKKYISETLKNQGIAVVAVNYRFSPKVKNVSAEIEASVKHNGIRLEDVTGPMTINSVHGKIEAIFSSVNQSNPISIISVHGLVDVSLPSNTKANLKMESKYGELLTNMDIEFNKNDDELRSFSSKVNGKLNGGGVEIYLVSNHGNVYLRNK